MMTLNDRTLTGQVQVDAGSLFDELAQNDAAIAALAVELRELREQCSAGAGRPPRVTDAFQNLGCERITTDQPSYANQTATNNVARINAWIEQASADRGAAVLDISGGFIAINDTLGRSMGAGRAIPGYNGDQAFRALPHGLEIHCGGGWANGRYGATYLTNERAAGFVWVGDADKPMIRLCGHGNVIRGNFYGYPYIRGSEVPKVTRCRAAIELVQAPNWAPCGHHDLAITASGFDKAVNIPAASGTTHCDHLLFHRLTTRDSLWTVYCDNDQAVNHKFNLVEHYCPRGEQSTVFDYQQGGDMKVGMMAMTGNYGATLLRICLGASNAGCYLIDGLSVDRALLKATEADQGYFRLLEKQGPSGFFVRIRGHMDCGGIRDRMRWPNGDGAPTVVLDSPNVDWRSLDLDILGLDDAAKQILAN